MGLARIDAYLASLPEGIDSYPQCTHKGEPLSIWLRRSPTEGLADKLPAPCAALLDAARPFPSWVPEVHANVLYLAILEVSFGDERAFLAHAEQCNRAVLQTPTNRVLFWVAAPKAILRAAGQRWSSLHRGSAIEVRVAQDTAAEVDLHYPPRLFPEIVLRGTATGFLAALENAGARDVQMDVRRVDETRAMFAARWR